MHCDGAAQHWDWLRQTSRAIIPTQYQRMGEMPISIYKKGNGTEREGGEVQPAGNQGTRGTWAANNVEVLITVSPSGRRPTNRRRGTLQQDADPQQQEDLTCCSICQDTLRREDRKELRCRYQFHKRCIDIWLWEHEQCPECCEVVHPSERPRAIQSAGSGMSPAERAATRAASASGCHEAQVTAIGQTRRAVQRKRCGRESGSRCGRTGSRHGINAQPKCCAPKRGRNQTQPPRGGRTCRSHQKICGRS